MNILIIEDDIANCKILERMLKQYGIITIANDGKEGLAAFREAIMNNDPYSLIFLDIMLPKIDGQEVLKEIRETEKNLGVFGSDGVKIIMISALGDSKNIIQAFRSQCEGYLVKPILQNKLHKEISRLFS